MSEEEVDAEDRDDDDEDTSELTALT